MYTSEYLSWKKSYTKPSTYPNYERWILRFQAFIEKPDELYTLEDISAFKAFLVRCEYSPKNIQYGLHLVRDYLSYLNSMHGFTFPLKLFKIHQERSNSHHAIVYEEFKKMDAVLPTSDPQSLQRKLMINLLFDTGVRGGELLGIKLSDLSRRKAVIRNEKNHRNRMVSWSEETENLLQRYLHLRTNLITTEDWLFISFRWKPSRQMTTRQLERIVKEVRLKAGIKTVVRPHSFRHGFVHRKLESGVPITTVSQMLGHSSTMNVINYAQLTSKELHKAWGISS